MIDTYYPIQMTKTGFISISKENLSNEWCAESIEYNERLYDIVA